MKEFKEKVFQLCAMFVVVCNLVVLVLPYLVLSHRYIKQRNNALCQKDRSRGGFGQYKTLNTKRLWGIDIFLPSGLLRWIIIIFT